MTRARAHRPAATVLLSAALAVALAGLGVASTEGLRAGFAVRSIVPPPALFDKVWHVAGGKHPTKVLDGIWARAAFLERGDRQLGIVALDLLGLFYDDIAKIRDQVRAALGDDVEVIVASTHSHSSIDTLGIYGPDETTSGINPDYQAFVRDQAAGALLDAASTPAAVSLRVGALPAPAGFNEYDRNRHPGSFDDTVRALRFVGADGAAVGTIVNWASHPELIDPDSGSDPDIGAGQVAISSDYVYALRETVQAGGGGPTVFLNGPVGAVTALAMPIIDPASGTAFPRRSVKKAYYVGTRIGETALAALGGSGAVTVADPELGFSRETFDLRVDNPFILALAAAGTVQRQTYIAGLPVPLGRDVRTEMARVTLGPVELLTVPGELQPDLYTGGYQPLEERANPDVPPERPIEPQMTGPFHFLVGLGQDELGYFVSATDYVAPTFIPVYGEGVDRNGVEHYQEELSLGRDTARSISQWASRMLGLAPEAGYLAYPGGFLDSGGRPLYEIPSADARGIWVDTSDSGRYEAREDSEVFTPLPSGVPAAFGFLDSQMQDLGTSPSGEARGVWIDGDGDGRFTAARDPHLFFDSYALGEGELEP